MIFVTEYTKAEHDDDDDACFDFEWSLPGTRSYTKFLMYEINELSGKS